MRQTVVVVIVGAALGLGLALAALQLIASLLFGVQPTDPLAVASAVALLLAPVSER